MVPNQMITETLQKFRARCLQMHEGDIDRTTMIEVVGGLLPLREMG